MARWKGWRVLLAVGVAALSLPLLMAGSGGCGSGGSGGGGAQRCGDCLGRGYNLNDEGYVDFDGKYKTRTVKVPCSVCGGSGTTK